MPYFKGHEVSQGLYDTLYGTFGTLESPAFNFKPNHRVGKTSKVCPLCGYDKITGDGSKSWCLNKECSFIES
jgi:hypothetical protein